jgi:D-alanyl-lipoteichoic acid acyltransferase DltB (MBOAT superfamily)
MGLKADYIIYIIASIVTWFLTGLWHGANYTFILWGLFNGFFLIIYHLFKKPRKKLLKTLGVDNNNILFVAIESFFTILLIICGWILFRSDNIGDALSYYSGIFDVSIFTIPEFLGRREALLIIFLIFFFFVFEYFGRDSSYPIASYFSGKKRIVRWAFYSILLFVIGMYMHTSEMPFIYLSF